MLFQTRRFKEIRKQTDHFEGKISIKQMQRNEAKHAKWLHNWALSLDAVKPISATAFLAETIPYKDLAALRAKALQDALPKYFPELKKLKGKAFKKALKEKTKYVKEQAKLVIASEKKAVREKKTLIERNRKQLNEARSEQRKNVERIARSKASNTEKVEQLDACLKKLRTLQREDKDLPDVRLLANQHILRRRRALYLTVDPKVSFKKKEAAALLCVAVRDVMDAHTANKSRPKEKDLEEFYDAVLLCGFEDLFLILAKHYKDKRPLDEIRPDLEMLAKHRLDVPWTAFVMAHMVCGEGGREGWREVGREQSGAVVVGLSG